MLGAQLSKIEDEVECRVLRNKAPQVQPTEFCEEIQPTVIQMSILLRPNNDKDDARKCE